MPLINQLPSKSARIPAGVVALPPNGFVEFCSAYPEQCRVTGAATSAPATQTPLRATLSDTDTSTASVSKRRAEPHCRAWFIRCGSSGLDQASQAAGALPGVLMINAAVNAEIAPETDMDRYGVKERWSINVRAGDCEDYVLTKRARLMAAGWEPSKLRVATVRLPSGELHAVLVVSTDAGDFALDNLTDDVRLWADAPYAWLTIQSEANPLVWQHITVLGRPV